MNTSTIVRKVKINKNGEEVCYVTIKADEIPTILKMLNWEEVEDEVNDYEVIKKVRYFLQNTKLGALTKNITLIPEEVRELHILTSAYLQLDYNYIIKKLNNLLNNVIEEYLKA